MKRRETNNKQIMGVQSPSLVRPDLGTEVEKMSREQVIDEVKKMACKSTGTCSYDAGHRIIFQAANAQVWPKPTNDHKHLTEAMAFMTEMAPENATEAMLAVQMIATNEAALMFVRRATLENQNTEGADANVLRATRLMRLFI